MAKSSKADDLASQSSFVFKGTVKKLKAATIPSLPVTEKTVVVSVDEIIRAPELFQSFAGSDITVQLGSRETVRKGEQVIFYTNSWMLGESLAVKSVGHTEVETAAAGFGFESVNASEPAGAMSQRLQERIVDADTVVTGKVTDVRTVSPPPTARGKKDALESFEAVSEHNPIWQEAVIEVADVEKGKGTSKQIVVRFPGSTDVLWSGAPKFETGQEGVFLLKDEEKSGKSAAASNSTAKGKRKATKVYTALDSEAIQPLQKVSAIRTLIKTNKR
jgi:hypothetical protein